MKWIIVIHQNELTVHTNWLMKVKWINANRLIWVNRSACERSLPSFVDRWQPTQWEDCSKTCGKGFQSRYYVCIGKSKDAGKHELPDDDCRGLTKPDVGEMTRACREILCPLAWTTDSWSEVCSVHNALADSGRGEGREGLLCWKQKQAKTGNLVRCGQVGNPPSPLLTKSWICQRNAAQHKNTCYSAQYNSRAHHKNITASH